MGMSGRTQLAIGMDVGSTTVKAVVVDPTTKEILWSDYQRHHTKQPEYVLSMLETILGAFPDHPAGGLAHVPHRAPARRRSARRPAASSCRRSTRSRSRSSTCTPTSASSSSSAGRTRRSSCSRRTRRPGEKTADRVHERQVRVRHRRHDRQVLPQGQRAARARHVAPLRRQQAAPRRRQVRRLRRDRHRQPHQERHPVERGPLLAGRRDRPAEPQRPHARRRRSSTACCSSAGRTRTCRSCRSAGACASRRRGTSAATTYPKDVPIEELIFVPKNAQYYAALGAVLYGLHEDGARRRLRRRSTPLDEYITTGRKARLGETAGPPLSKTAGRARRVPRALSHPQVRADDVRRRARPCAPSSASTAGRRRRKAVLVDYEDGKILCKAYQLSKGNPIQDTKELLTQLRRLRRGRPEGQARDHGLRRHGLRGRRAPGVRPRRREHRRDRRAHDERRALLRRRGRHLRHRRAGHQGPLHEERRHRQLPPVEQLLGRQRDAAPGHGRLVRRARSPQFADVAFKAELAPKFSLRVRRLPRHRPRQLPEGGLLQGGDARRSRAGAAEERLAVRRADPAPRGARHEVRPAGRHAVQPRGRQGAGRLHQGARARTPRSSCTRTRARPAPSARRWRPFASSSARAVELHRHRCARSTSSTRRRTTTRRVCHFCPNDCKRTFIDTKRPDGSHQPLHRGLLLREGHRRVARRRCSSLVEERKKIAKEFPNLVDYEAKRAFMHFYDAAPMPEDGLADQVTSSSRRASSACAASR